MLASLDAVLPLLKERQVCLPGFDIAGGQPDFVLGVLEACEACRCPALLQVWAPGALYMDLGACVEMVRFCAARASVPVVLHLDHGRDEAEVEAALALGFTSVMFDGSALPLEENVRRTRAMADLAHRRGATVEGELGRLGCEQGGAGPADLTDPDQAETFARATGIDVLAPAVGNVHASYDRPTRLRLDLVRRIAQRTGLPLSLHGGTGIPMDDVRAAAALGVAKLNVATLLHRRYADALQGAALADPAAPYRWQTALAAGRDAVRATAAAYYRELAVEGLCHGRAG